MLCKHHVMNNIYVDTRLVVVSMRSSGTSRASSPRSEVLKALVFTVLPNVSEQTLKLGRRLKEHLKLTLILLHSSLHLTHIC